MLPLYDMMMKAQNGRMAELLARQVNLTRQQAELALEAVLPAFSEALQRNASDPYGFARLFSAMGPGDYGRYFEDAARAFTPEGLAAGNRVLAELFGSNELTRSVAARASEATGLAQEAFRQMMPALAAMMTGGFFKQATGQLGEGDNPFLAAFNPFMGATGATGTSGGARQPAGFQNPFAEMIEGMTRAMQPGAKADTAPDPFAANPFFKAYQDAMTRYQETAAAATGTPSAPRDSGTGEAKPSYDRLFGDMFETGVKQREAYEKAIRTMVGEFLSRPHHGEKKPDPA